MKLKSFLAGTVIALCSLQASAGTMRVGMETTFAPFEFYNAQNELVGFDVDIANRICEILKDDCQFQNLPFEGLISALKLRKIDFAISGIDITPEREKQIEFSKPYYENSAQLFVVTQDSADVPFSELQSKKIGVQNGTTQQKYLATEFPKIDAPSYAQITTALMDLKNHRIDAFFIDASVAKEIAANNPEFKVLSDKVINHDYFGFGLGIAVRQGNLELLNKINQALAEMQADGSYKKIYDKWFN